MAKKILLLLSAFSAVLLSPAWAKDVVLENQSAAFVFSPEYNYGLKRIVNKTTGRAVEFDKPASGKGSLWSLELVDGDRKIYGNDQVKVRNEGDRMVLLWDDVTVGQSTIKVEVTVTLPEDSGIADWQLQVKTAGNPAPWVKSVVFPLVDGVKSLGDDYLYYGEYLGRVVRNPAERLRQVIINHPGRWSMQFAAFHGSEKLKANDLVPTKGGFKVNGFYRGSAADETGMYLAADDGGDYQKTLELNGGRRNFSLSASHYPALPFWPPDSGKREAEFSYTIPYSMKLGTFCGGIGEAAALYRSMVENREWLKNGKLRTPQNPVSPKVLECAFWAKFYHGANKVVPEIAMMQEYLQVPVNTHWCRYGVGRFDDNNLEYFPSMANFREGVQALRRLGVGVAPYLCCAVWDQDTESYRRYGMEKAAALNEFGAHYLWMLAGNQPSSWMNPASPLWREKYLEATMKMFGQWGADGQYLDVLACAGKLSYNTDLHQPHGGNYWVEGNRKLLSSLKESCATVEAAPFLVTEGFSENYINQIDAFLTLDITRYGWKTRQNSDVFPLFSLVYHDFAVAYGSDCGQRITPGMLRWQMGLSFIWGVQLCYSDMVIRPPDDRIHDRYTKELVQAWYRSGYPFLTGGQGIETAQVPKAELAGNAAVAVISAPYQVALEQNLSFPWEGPSVPGSAWRNNEGNIGITLANISGKDQPVKILLDREALKTTKNTVWQSWPLPVKKIGSLDRLAELNMEVPADRALILEIRDEAPPVIRPLLEPELKVALADTAAKTFPVLSASSDILYGAEGALIENSAGRLQVLSPRTGKPARLNDAPDWRQLEGFGGPRDPENRTFYVLEPTGYALTGQGTATVQFRHGVFAAEVVMESEGALTAPVIDGRQARLIACRDGKYESGGKLALTPGRYRVIGAVDLPESGGKKMLSELAEISQKTAAEGKKILSGPDSLSNETRNQGEKWLALGNAAAFLVSGKRVSLDHPHDWLLPSYTEHLHYQGADNGTLVLLNDAHRANIAVKPEKNNTFAVTIKGWETASNLLRMLYETEINVGGNTFKLTSLDYLEAANPLLAEIDPRDAVVTKAADAEVIYNGIVITNTAPFELPVRITADLPPGWEFPPELNEAEFKLKAQGRRRIPLTFRCRPGTKSDGRNFRVYVNYSGDVDSAVSEDFKVAERQTALIPAGGAVQSKASTLIRHHGTAAVVVGDQQQEISMTIEPGKVNRRNKELKWTLLDSLLNPVKNGTIEFKNENPVELKIPVDGKGVYFVRFTAAFFKVKINNAAGYGFSCWEHDPYILHGKERAVLSFMVNPGARSFEFQGADGGPLEPARVIIRTPDGKAVFDYSGNYSPDRWIKVPVPDGADGKIWTVEVIPVEDMQIALRGPVSHWVSPAREAVLAEK
jgi:hypothetical protein